MAKSTNSIQPQSILFAPGANCVDFDEMALCSSTKHRTYIDGFRDAALTLVTANAADNSSNPYRAVAYPILHLFRHYLEVQLKYLVRLSVELKLQPSSPGLTKALREHVLLPLWNFVQCLMGQVDPVERSFIDGVINDFHTLDPSGEGARYAETLNGQATLQGLPNRISLDEVATAIKRIDAVFSEWSTALEAMSDPPDC